LFDRIVDDDAQRARLAADDRGYVNPLDMVVGYTLFDDSAQSIETDGKLAWGIDRDL
jgi:hypothetical protein